MATLINGAEKFDSFPFPAWIEDSISGEVVARNESALALGPLSRCTVQGSRLRRFPIPAIQSPGALVVMEPDSIDCNSSMDQLRGRSYEAIARHEPLGSVLSTLAQGAEDAIPGVKVAVFQLEEGCLRAHASSVSRSRLLAALDGLRPDGLQAAPWWILRGTAVHLIESEAWASFAAAAKAEGVDRCWSDLLVTAAGEVVGTLTLLLPPEFPDPAGFSPKLNKLKHLAALALEQHHLLEELYFLAQKDPLTGLWNRMQLERLLGQALLDGKNLPAIIWLELTGFHRVNSILGSAISDDVLREAANRLKASIRPVDKLARMGADDFAVVLTEVSSPSEAFAVAERLRRRLTGQYETQGHSIQLAVTAGISFADAPEDQPELILRRAKMAMECAHQRSPGSLACFEPAMQSRSRDRLELENLLRNALPRRELFLQYQPQFCLTTGKLAGCEALMRWRQPDIGLVSPSAFISVAEDVGLIGQFGEWALEEVCRQGQMWRNLGHPVRMSVNVSPHQFKTGELVRQVELTLVASGLPPGLLELEITESAVLDNMDTAVAQMRQLQSLGVTFALDDFGSGQSSLAWLRDLPVQRLKIDRRFLQELEFGGKPPILHSIVALAHELHLVVIIEGVETEEQFTRVQALGCDELQGFLRGRPMDPSDFASRLLLSQSL